MQDKRFPDFRISGESLAGQTRVAAALEDVRLHGCDASPIDDEVERQLFVSIF